MKKVALLSFAVAFLAFTAEVAVAGNYWDNWPKGQAKGAVPPCGTQVVPLGFDDILQDTVDTYCALKPGLYTSYINPNAMNVYQTKGSNYPDGKTAILEFKDIGVAFATDFKNGKPVYDVIIIETGKSAASNEAEHPLNPATCAACHISYDNLCPGWVCGKRDM